jgi:hypothetical protein
MTQLITERIRNNDDAFFKKFTKARAALETFLIENKSLIGVILQNLGKKQRIPKMRDLLMFLVSEGKFGNSLKPEEAIKHLGLRSRIFDVVSAKTATDFSDDAKSTIYIQKALESALICPICKGKLDPKKSVSYDHKTPVRDGGSGDPQNGDLVHPYCNTAIKN